MKLNPYPYEVIMESVIIEGKKVASRIITFDVDPETGARSVRDIVEGNTEYNLIDSYSDELMWLRDDNGLTFISGENRDRFSAPPQKDRRAFIRNVLKKLVPIS